MQGHVVTASGAHVKTGLILTDRNHTDVTLPLSGGASVLVADPAQADGEHGRTAAPVVYGTDEVGVWFAGSLLPGTTKTQLARARASAVSLECWPDPSEPSGYAPRLPGSRSPGLLLGVEAMPRAAAFVGGVSFVEEPKVAVTDSSGGSSKAAPAKSTTKIKRGDTLTKLAKEHGTTVKDPWPRTRRSRTPTRSLRAMT